MRSARLARPEMALKEGRIACEELDAEELEQALAAPGDAKRLLLRQKFRLLAARPDVDAQELQGLMKHLEELEGDDHVVPGQSAPIPELFEVSAAYPAASPEAERPEAAARPY